MTFTAATLDEILRPCWALDDVQGASFCLTIIFTVIDTSALQHRLYNEILAVRRISESWLMGAGTRVIVTLNMPRNRCRIVFLLAYACLLSQIWLNFWGFSDGVTLTSSFAVGSSSDSPDSLLYASSLSGHACVPGRPSVWQLLRRSSFISSYVASRFISLKRCSMKRCSSFSTLPLKTLNKVSSEKGWPVALDKSRVGLLPSWGPSSRGITGFSFGVESHKCNYVFEPPPHSPQAGWEYLREENIQYFSPL